jgi:prophage regulatory protein
MSNSAGQAQLIPTNGNIPIKGRRTDKMAEEILDSKELEQLTGTRASTWRYWASIGQGPASFKLGRRRVWKRSIIEAWLAEQEQSA